MSGDARGDVQQTRKTLAWAGELAGFVKPTLSDDQVRAIMAAQKNRIATANGDRVVPTTITRQMRRHPERFTQTFSYRASPTTSWRKRSWRNQVAMRAQRP